MATVDEVSPVTYGQDLIQLTLPPEATLQVFVALLIDVSYIRALPAGIVLPLEMTITTESGAALYHRQVFRRFAPNVLPLIPKEGGRHLVRLAEQHHNRWFGFIEFDVVGSPFSRGF